MPIAIRRLLHLLSWIMLATSAQAAPLVRHGALADWNVVLVTLDATDPSRIGTYGGSPKTMPFLDGLAREAVVFENAYCTTGSTSPSHATILSGVLPGMHGVAYNGLTVRPNIPWLPEILKRSGYFTAGSSVAPFMSAAESFNRGFDLFASSKGDRGVSSNADGYDQLMELLGKGGWKGLSTPFFVWLHLKGGHDPLLPIDPKFLRRFSTTLPADAKPGELQRGHFDVRVTPQILQAWYAYYDANLSEADSTLERLYRDLDRAGLLKNTLLVITADHGETFDHGIIGEHWPSPWESTLRIPLILYANGVLNHRLLRDELISTEDFTPSILDLLGIDDHDDRWSKVTFFNRRRTSIIAASPYALEYETILSGVNPSHAAQVHDHISDLKSKGLFYWAFIERSVSGPINKLLYFEHGNQDTFETGYELYDVTGDPKEQRDLLQHGPARRRQAIHMLSRARSEDPFFAASPGINGKEAARRTPAGQPTLGLSPETIRILRSLGYVH